MSLFFSVMILYHKNRMATYFITPGYWHVISDAVHDSNALSVETLRQQHGKFTVQMRRLICAFVSHDEAQMWIETNCRKIPTILKMWTESSCRKIPTI